MSHGDEEGFLARWARRKSAAGDDQNVPAADRRDSTELPTNKSPAEANSVSGTRRPESDEPFDLSSLPPIDSIGADTDLTPFFHRGVPSELRHAALRRMWVTDPAIRDFKGLQEYDWDFVSGDIPGFGAIGPDVDVRAMAEQLLGGGKQVETAAAPEQPARGEPDHRASAGADVDPSIRQPAEPEMPSARPPEVAEGDADQQSVLLQRDEHIASQNEDPESGQQVEDFAKQATLARVRRHGSALPS